MLGHLGHKMANKMGKITTRSAKMIHQRLPDGKDGGGCTLTEPVWGSTFYNYSLLEMKTPSS